MAVAVVTGAGSGIGAATARALAARGDDVVCADIVKEAAEETARDVSNALAVHVDVSDAASCDAMIAAAIDRFARSMASRRARASRSTARATSSTRRTSSASST